MAKRKTELLKCEIINTPFNEEEQKEYDRGVCKALATALYRSLEPSQIDSIIRQLKEEVDFETGEIKDNDILPISDFEDLSWKNEEK